MMRSDVCTLWTMLANKILTTIHAFTATSFSSLRASTCSPSGPQPHCCCCCCCCCVGLPLPPRPLPLPPRPPRPPLPPPRPRLPPRRPALVISRCTARGVNACYLSLLLTHPSLRRLAWRPSSPTLSPLLSCCLASSSEYHTSPHSASAGLAVALTLVGTGTSPRSSTSS
jgi:hypothetical protein